MATSFKHPDVIDIPGLLAHGWRDFRFAMGFLTCLPVGPSAPGDRDTIGVDDEQHARGLVRVARAGAYFPAVGAGVGSLAALALIAAFELGLQPLACALVGLAIGIAVSGALHEDGLADFADGLGGGASRDARLGIMRDSRIGTFGTLAIVFGVALRAALLSGLSSSTHAALAMIAAAAVSRAALPAIMQWQPAARSDGLSAYAGAPGQSQVIAAMLVALAVSFLVVGFYASLAVGFAVALAALAVAALAQRTLGGQTGDVLGSVQVVGEMAALVAIAAVE